MAQRNLIFVGPSASNLTQVRPTPSTFGWGLQDISSPDAGRVHDAGNTMYKMRTSQKRKIDLAWLMLTSEEASAILRAFNPEYFYVRFWDPMEDGYLTRQFYRGDCSAPLRWFDLPRKGTRFATVSFNIIER